jgi:hypothetical protein
MLIQDQPQSAGGVLMRLGDERARPVGVEWAEFMAARHDPAAIPSAAGPPITRSDNMLRLLFHSREGSMHSLEVTTFDVDRDAAARDRKARIALYQQADRILVADEAAVMPLGYVLGAQLVQPYVQMPRTPPSRLLLKHVVVERPEG